MRIIQAVTSDRMCLTRMWATLPEQDDPFRVSPEGARLRAPSRTCIAESPAGPPVDSRAVISIAMLVAADHQDQSLD